MSKKDNRAQAIARGWRCGWSLSRSAVTLNCADQAGGIGHGG